MQLSMREVLGIVAACAIFFAFYDIDDVALIALVTIAVSTVCVSLEVYRTDVTQESLVVSGCKSAFVAAIFYGSGAISGLFVKANLGDIWAASDSTASTAILACAWCAIAPFVGASIGLLAQGFRGFFGSRF